MKNKKLTLIEQAKLKYPVGTKFINPVDKNTCVIKEQGYYFEGNNNIYHALTKNAGSYDAGSSGCIYIDGKWAEIIEDLVKKDYEILSLLLQRSERHEVVSMLGNSYDYIISLLNCQGNKIHSVRRLSDDEIFTIGDKIQTSTILTIDSFIIIDNELLISPLEIIGTIGLNNFSKAKQPLFTTEDGVDIFEGDEYWIAHDDKIGVESFKWKINNSPYKCINIIPTKREDFAKNGNYRFSTKEKAEEYILMNKPSLSLNDILNVWSELSGNTCESIEKQSTLFSKFKEFVIEQQYK